MPISWILVDDFRIESIDALKLNDLIQLGDMPIDMSKSPRLKYEPIYTKKPPRR